MNDVVRIERGNPTDEEIAAVLIALTLAADPGAHTTTTAPAPVRWLRPERRIAYVASHSWAAA